ncbi:MAG TPA: hypothetical protein V6C57_10370 [Coleofasciculaceae cyanobacterium]
MPITEPMTMLTDYAIAAETAYFSVVLLRVGHYRQQVSMQLWSAAFCCVAIAALLGGTCHGFLLGLENATVLLLWHLMLNLLGLASCFMLLSSCKSVLPRRWQLWAWLLVGSKSFIYLSWMAVRPNTQDAFAYGVIDYFSAMLLVLILQAGAAVYSNSKGAIWIIFGIVTSGVAIALQASSLSLFQHFNHNDLYHLVQMVALYGFYRGATLTKDR